MKNTLKTAIAILAFIFTGCAMAPNYHDEKELEDFVMSLVNKNAEMEKIRAERRGRGIKNISIAKSGPDHLISVDLDEASAREVIRRIFKETGVRYVFDNVTVHGTVTARFESFPLTKALNTILQPILLSAEMTDGMVIVKSGIDEKKEKDPAEKTYVEMKVRNLGLDDVIKLLEGVYQPNMDGVREVGFGPVYSSNTVFLSGSEKNVADAAQMIMKADRKMKHVIIEVLVVEFSSGDLEELGTKLTEFADGKFENINIDFSGNSADIISFSKIPVDGSYPNHLTTFTGAINLLISDEKARLISRPYIATMSGKQARIEIINERYVVVDRAEGTSSAEPIESGVILEITPVVLGKNDLRMEVSVEDSQFSNVTIANVTTEKKKNAAQTIMNVQDGQTIIIGGLVLNRRAWSNSGFPFLRHVPVLNLLLGDEENFAEDREVAIYITPHLWEPDMVTPLIEPDALKAKDGKDINSILDKYK